MTLKDENLQAIFDTIETYDLVRRIEAFTSTDMFIKSGRPLAEGGGTQVEDFFFESETYFALAKAQRFAAFQQHRPQFADSFNFATDTTVCGRLTLRQQWRGSGCGSNDRQSYSLPCCRGVINNWHLHQRGCPL